MIEPYYRAGDAAASGCGWAIIAGAVVFLALMVGAFFIF